MSTNKIRNSAWAYLGDTDLFLGYLPSISLKSRESDRFLFSWGIIRYIDEIIDSKLDSSKKMEQLIYYKEKIDEIEKGHVRYDDLKEVEKYIYHYFELERESKIKTVENFKNIIHSFELDINRTNKVLSWKEYNEYLFYRSESCMYLYYKLLINSDEPWVYDLGRHYAHVFQYSDDVIDLQDDMAYGQINITAEELSELQIDYTNIRHEDMLNFANHRKGIILEEYRNFTIIMKKNVTNFNLRRLLQMSAGYNISPILGNNFMPGRIPRLPFRSLIVRATKLKNQAWLYSFLRPILYLYTIPSWYDYKKLDLKSLGKNTGGQAYDT